MLDQAVGSSGGRSEMLVCWQADGEGRTSAAVPRPTVGSALECRRYCVDGGVMRCGLRQRHALTKLGLP
jgi:hypothetical protein